MPIFKAVKTIDKINEVLEQTQGSIFRGLLRTTMPLAEDAYREADDPFRTHLGASLIGRECSRELWYTFRWTTVTKHEGRILRLFNRGHLEEPRFVALLRMIGCTVWQYDEFGKQFRMGAHGGHFGGSLDGVALGVPDLPDRPLLTEFKTHNDKSFKKLEKEGVRSAKFEHFIQQQMYMGAYGLTGSLYLATNKNDDDLYGEIVSFDREMYDRHQERGCQIVRAMLPPKRVSNTPGWLKCKFCDHRLVCHHGKPFNRTCRSCIHVAPVDGGWACRHPSNGGGADHRNKDDQLAACDNYACISNA